MDFLFVGNKICPHIYGNKSASPEIGYKNFFFSIMKEISIKNNFLDIFSWEMPCSISM